MTRRPERAVTRLGEPARMPAQGRICGQEAGPEWCQDPVFSRGLCRPHYRRVSRGQDLDPDQGRHIGVTPSGHGVWGVVDVDDTGRLRCHDCGRAFVALGVHVGMIHGSVRDYRLRHGLPMVVSLASERLRAALADAAARPESLARLAVARRPVEALAGADPAMRDRGQRVGGRHHR